LYTTHSGCWELVGPGNKHYAFSTSYPINVYHDTVDPFLLGATLSCPPGGTLVNGHWRYYYVTFKDGTIWYFDYYGGLVLQVDPYGHMVVINRDSNTGFVTQLYSNSSPNRLINYNLGSVNGATRVTSIQSQYSTGGGVKTWTVGYDGSSTPKMTSLTQPDGGVYSYTWGSSYTRADGVVLPLLTKVVNPRGNTPATIVSDTSGRTTSITKPES
jgi:hypothetical protein